jgi:hypothetical protein
MCADQEKHNRHSKEKLLGRCILISVVDLLPHVQIVVCPCIKVEWHTPYPVEHEKVANHVEDVGKRPDCLLRERDGKEVEEEMEEEDYKRMDEPGT